MRRTVLSAVTLACTAVLVGTVPAFADGGTPAPAAPRQAPSAVPSQAARAATPVPPAAAPTEAAGRGQVAVVPKGAPDTGVVVSSSGTGTGTGSWTRTEGGLAGGGAAAVLVAAGATVFVVRRRRATGA